MILSSTSRQMLVSISAKRMAVLSKSTNYRLCSNFLKQQLQLLAPSRRCFSTSTNTNNESSNVLSNHDSFVQKFGFREGLPRFPDPTTPPGILRGLDYFGTVVFAASGGLTAATCGCDLLGTLAIGTITAVGGGTIRDTIVLNKQPFWFEEWEYLIMSLLAAGAVFFGWNELEAGKRYQLGEYLDLGTLKAADGGEGDMMQWGDAIGLGAFAVIGAMNGLRANSPILITCLCGMMTCTFGGLTRDTLLNRPVRIFHPYSDAYASIAFSGAVGYVILRTLAPAQQALRIGSTVTGIVMARKVTWENGYRLPYWGPGMGISDKNVVKGNTIGSTTSMKQTVTYGTSDPRTTAK